MNANKLKTILIIACCFVVALCSEIRCMDGGSDRQATTPQPSLSYFSSFYNIVSATSSKIHELALDGCGRFGKWIVSYAKDIPPAYFAKSFLEIDYKNDALFWQGCFYEAIEDLQQTLNPSQDQLRQLIEMQDIVFFGFLSPYAYEKELKGLKKKWGSLDKGLYSSINEIRKNFRKDLLKNPNVTTKFFKKDLLDSINAIQNDNESFDISFSDDEFYEISSSSDQLFNDFEQMLAYYGKALNAFDHAETIISLWAGLEANKDKIGLTDAQHEGVIRFLTQSFKKTNRQQYFQILSERKLKEFAQEPTKDEPTLSETNPIFLTEQTEKRVYSSLYLLKGFSDLVKGGVRFTLEHPMQTVAMGLAFQTAAVAALSASTTPIKETEVETYSLPMSVLENQCLNDDFNQGLSNYRKKTLLKNSKLDKLCKKLCKDGGLKFTSYDGMKYQEEFTLIEAMKNLLKEKQNKEELIFIPACYSLSNVPSGNYVFPDDILSYANIELFPNGEESSCRTEVSFIETKSKKIMKNEYRICTNAAFFSYSKADIFVIRQQLKFVANHHKRHAVKSFYINTVPLFKKPAIDRIDGLIEIHKAFPSSDGVDPAEITAGDEINVGGILGTPQSSGATFSLRFTNGIKYKQSTVETTKKSSDGELSWTYKISDKIPGNQEKYAGRDFPENDSSFLQWIWKIPDRDRAISRRLYNCTNDMCVFSFYNIVNMKSYLKKDITKGKMIEEDMNDETIFPLIKFLIPQKEKCTVPISYKKA